jgi:hypothetical protein
MFGEGSMKDLLATIKLTGRTLSGKATAPIFLGGQKEFNIVGLTHPLVLSAGSLGSVSPGGRFRPLSVTGIFEKRRQPPVCGRSVLPAWATGA